MLNLPIKILKTIRLEAETDQVTFTGIDDLVAAWDAAKNVTSRHLVLIINARSIDPSDSITNFLRVNGSLAMDYYIQRLSGHDNVADAGRMDGANAINLPPINGANQPNSMGGSVVLIPNAFNTVNHKAVLALGGASEYVVEAVAARWAQAAAITAVSILEGVDDDFVVGSTFHLGVIDERYLLEEILDAGGGTFDNIPQGEGDLVVIGYCRTALAAVEDTVICAINDDTIAGNYPSQELIGRAGGPPTAAQPNFEVGIVTGANATGNTFGALALVISQFTKDNQPHLLSESGFHQMGGPTGEVRVISSRRANIEPINKLYIAGSNFDDFAVGSILSLYRVPKRIIERVELTAPQATITFANIPQNFEALILHIYARTSRAAVSDSSLISFNNDVVAPNYNFQYLNGIAAAVGVNRLAGNRDLVSLPGNNEAAGEYGGGTLLIPGYAETDRHKHYLLIGGRQDNAVEIRSSRWLDTDAITEIDITPNIGPNFLAGSVFELEGVLRKEGLPAEEGMIWGV